jgi:hypothetical protein
MNVLAIMLLTIMALATTGTAGAQAKPLDPDCTPAKAVKGAAQRATVGVGNRCKAGETVRDTLGVDDRNVEIRNGDRPRKKDRKD